MHASVCDVAERRFAQAACLPEVSEDGVVCMMRAFGSGGWLGPIIAVPHKCSATARGQSSLDGLSFGSGGEEGP